MTRDLETELVTLLLQYLSPLTSKALLRVSKDRLKLSVLEGSLPKELGEVLERATKSFLPPARHQQLVASLRELGADAPLQRFVVHNENDILSVRNTAYKLAIQFKGTNFSAQRVATAVSELARNIVNYTPGGSITLGLAPDTKHLLVRSQDNGTGIDALEEILAGRYKSRTGMGLGILGVKRLSTRFEVRSNKSGTMIEAEIKL